MNESPSMKILVTGASGFIGSFIVENEAEGELLHLPITKVEPRSDQPRTKFDDEKLQELADSIAQYGLIP